MAIRQPILIAAILATMLALGSASSAHAGFMSAGIDGSSDSLSSAGLASPPADTRDEPFQGLERHPGPAALLGASGSTGGMTSHPTPDTPGTSAAGMIFAPPQSLGAASLARLIAEKKLSLPPPPGTRLFRPPRS